MIRTPRILIADDNPQNLYLLESILKGYRFEVITAKNGADALEAALKDPPDLAVADILMPVMDGFELCRRWKSDQRLKKIPFMFYTATYTDPRDEQFALSLGADRFVIKPQKPEVLGRIIRDLLSEIPQETHAREPASDETESLRQHNKVLYRKLEKKVRQLEEEIGDHRKTEAELKRSETKYRRLYESMMDAFIRVDMDGRILEFNRSFREMLGYSDDELRHLTYQDLTPEYWHAVENNIIASQILVRGYSDVYEKEYRKKDGAIVPVELRASLIRDEAGRPAGMWAIVRDITEHKAAGERIRLANRKLTLMNDVTYQDIQNKVTGLRGYVNLIGRKVQDPDLAGLIEKEESLLKSIHDLIAKTKDYQQMGIDQSRWISLEGVIRMQFSRLSRPHNVSLECDLHGLEIHADPLIDRVIYNLLHNAIRHGRNLTRVSFSHRETPESIVLICEDDGIGIPAGEKSSIFDRVVGGPGKFGLFFVREFLTLSGMTIRETGMPGRGARFEITVPRAECRFSEDGTAPAHDETTP